MALLWIARRHWNLGERLLQILVDQRRLDQDTVTMAESWHDMVLVQLHVLR